MDGSLLLCGQIRMEFQVLLVGFGNDVVGQSILDLIDFVSAKFRRQLSKLFLDDRFILVY